ncbi:MAG: UpxY family transcription antiterminator [Ignavibacteriales bacterium]|jgi:transcription antitermination factor NusG|nr:UpxY family transcription antiterminator [Ignavibacteriales bacterium]
MNTETNNEKKWFALYTKPKHEFKAEEELRKLSIDCYLPTIIVKRRWKDRKKKIITPLFTSYIFIYATEIERRYSLALDSIIKTVCFQGKPAVIPEEQIESIRIMVNNNDDIILSDKIVKGAKVKITEGPFKDIVGVVINVNSENYLYISLDILNRSISVRLPIDSVYKIME